MKSERQRKDGVTRRGFLSGSGAVVTGALLGGRLEAEGQRAAAAPSRLVDVHHHFLPQPFLDYVKRVGGNSPPWSVQSSLDLLDKYKIEMALLSISTPGVEDATVCRQCNDAGMKVVSDHPTRFGLFASLPLPDVDASLKELAYAMDTLHADGVVLESHCGDGRYIGDPAFAPVFEEMNRRKTIIFVHPHTPWYEFNRKDIPVKFPGWNIGELPFDTTRAILSLLSEGTAEKYPDVRFIFSHGGGVMPFLISRIALLGSRSNGFKTGDYQRIKRIASTFYYDLTNTIEPPPVKAILQLAAPSHLLFGTDFPYGDGRNQSGEFVGKMIAELPKVGLTPAQRVGVQRANAEALFPRLKRG